MAIEPKKWSIAQYWRDVLFLNYKVDPSLIQKSLPATIQVDTFYGDAYLSVVPFRMSDIRFPWSPILPFSNLWELNLRTYVKYGNYRGVYFYTLETDHHLAKWIARTFFQLPYRYRFLRGDITEKRYVFEAPGYFQVDAGLSQIPIAVEEYHYWLAERYCLITEDKGRVWVGENIHQPWDISYVKIYSLEEKLREEFFPGETTPLDSVFYSKGLPVFFHQYKRLV